MPHLGKRWACFEGAPPLSHSLVTRLCRTSAKLWACCLGSSPVVTQPCYPSMPHFGKAMGLCLGSSPVVAQLCYPFMPHVVAQLCYPFMPHLGKAMGCVFDGRVRRRTSSLRSACAACWTSSRFPVRRSAPHAVSCLSSLVGVSSCTVLFFWLLFASQLHATATITYSAHTRIHAYTHKRTPN